MVLKGKKSVKGKESGGTLFLTLRYYFRNGWDTESETLKVLNIVLSQYPWVGGMLLDHYNSLVLVSESCSVQESGTNITPS